MPFGTMPFGTMGLIPTVAAATGNVAEAVIGCAGSAGPLAGTGGIAVRVPCPWATVEGDTKGPDEGTASATGRWDASQGIDGDDNTVGARDSAVPPLASTVAEGMDDGMNAGAGGVSEGGAARRSADASPFPDSAPGIKRPVDGENCGEG